jgi:hypothetical protein
MFVRTKTTRSGTVKHYLVECRREGGKVRQKVLYYLGSFPTAKARLAWLDERVKRDCRDAVKLLRDYGDATPPRRVRELILFIDLEILRNRAEADRLREIIRGGQTSD